MTASAVEVGLRRRKKVNRPSKLQNILLGCYIELGPGSQESRIYFGWCSCSVVNQ